MKNNIQPMTLKENIISIIISLVTFIIVWCSADLLTKGHIESPSLFIAAITYFVIRGLLFYIKNIRKKV